MKSTLQSGLRATLCALGFLAFNPSAPVAAELTCLRDERAPTYSNDPAVLRRREEYRARKFPLGARPNDQRYCSVALLKGPIVAGDYERFLAFYRRHHPLLDHLLLHSRGGNVDEAIGIGTMLRRYFIEAKAPIGIAGEGHLDHGQSLCRGADCVCASACALIWFGAPLRSGDVGLHRPYIRDQKFGQLPGEQAMSLYRRQLNDAVGYMAKMGVHKPHIDLMIETEAEDIRWLQAWSGSGGPSLTRALDYYEWARSACSVLSPREVSVMEELGERELSIELQRGGRPLTQTERTTLTGLKSRDLAASDCEDRLRSSNREKLAAP